VFEEFQGIPVHPLLVHAAVVLLPMQVAAALAYAVLPRFRRYVAWFAVGTAVAAPMAAFLAKQSGEKLQARLIRNGTSDAGVLARINQHKDFGTLALYASLTLGALVIIMFLVLRMRAARTDEDGQRGGGLVGIALMVVTIVAAGATLYYVIRTGDSGAKMVWTGI